MLATLHKITLQEAPAQLGRLFEEHHARLFRAAYRITGNASDAEDVLQNVFLRLARREEGLEAGNVEGYLFRAAINAAVDLCRARRSGLLTAGREDGEPGLPEVSAGGPRPADALELRGWLRHALGELSPRQAEIFVLRHLEGYDNQEIARLLDTSPSVVAVSLFRARAALRKQLGALGGGSK